MCVCVFVCVFQNRVQSITLSCMVGFGNNLAQLILMTRRCVLNKNHAARQRIHMKNQALFSLKDKSKKTKMLSAAIFVWRYKG